MRTSPDSRYRRRSPTHLGIDAAIGVAEALHQRARNGQVADAGVGIDVGRRAALDAFDYLQPRGRCRSRVRGRADRTRARPASRRHRYCRESAADGPAQPAAFSTAATEARLMMDTTFLATSEKLWLARTEFGRTAPWAARAIHSRNSRRRTPRSRRGLAACASRRGRPRGLRLDDERVGRLVIVGAQRRQPLIAHQHQETNFGEVGGGGGIEAAGAVLDGIEPVGGQGRADRQTACGQAAAARAP